MKNRMDVPQEYEPVLPEKVEAHIAKKKQETSQDSLLTQTATAVGKVMGQLLVSRHKYAFMDDRFDVSDLTDAEFRELKSACINHLSHLIPGIEKEILD